MIVVCDTSVVLNLCCIRRQELLLRLFQQVAALPEVTEEFRRLASRDPKFKCLEFPAWIEVRETGGVIPREAALLDPGERAAITLALSVSADAVLIDERLGQRVAAGFGLRTIGVLGILIEARRRALILAMGSELDALREQAGFWMSDELRDRAIRLGENPSFRK